MFLFLLGCENNWLSNESDFSLYGPLYPVQTNFMPCVSLFISNKPSADQIINMIGSSNGSANKIHSSEQPWPLTAIKYSKPMVLLFSNLLPIPNHFFYSPIHLFDDNNCSVGEWHQLPHWGSPCELVSITDRVLLTTILVPIKSNFTFNTRNINFIFFSDWVNVRKTAFLCVPWNTASTSKTLTKILVFLTAPFFFFFYEK